MKHLPTSLESSYILTQLIEAKSVNEIDNIVKENLFKVSQFNRSKLLNYAERGKQRAILAQEKKERSDIIRKNIINKMLNNNLK